MINQPYTQLTEMTDVVERASTLASDANTLYDNLVAGTLEEYYDQVIVAIATDLMAVPVDRTFNGLPEIEDPAEVVAAIDSISSILSRTFAKSQQSITKDLSVLVEQLPIDDLREARFRRNAGLLN